MGVDLDLLPFSGASGLTAVSHDVLRVDTHTDMFRAIERLAWSTVPPDFHSYRVLDMKTCMSTFGVTMTDAYETPLKYVLARPLARCMRSFELSVRNRAVAAYLGMLDHEHRIALFWH